MEAEHQLLYLLMSIYSNKVIVRGFNGRAQGCAEHLNGTSLAALCRYARQEYDENDAEDSADLF